MPFSKRQVMTDSTAETSALLIDAAEAAKLVAVSRSTWFALAASGRTPAAVRLGRCVRYRRQEVLDWIRAGCPCRNRWTWEG